MNEWREIKLKKVIKRIFSGGTPSTKREDYWGGELLWLSSGETNKKYISDTEKKITELGSKESSTKLAKKNSVVIASAGQGKTRGQVSFLKRDMFINQSIIAIEVDEEYILPKYLFFNLSSRYNEIRILSDASSSRGSITTGFLNKLTISVPNINTQKKIVNILSGYDELIENNNRRIQILEKTAEELYKEWFVRMRFPGFEKTKFDKGIPEGWRIENIKNTVPVLTGKKDANYADENGQYMFFTCSQQPSRSKGYSFDSHSILLAGNGDFNVKLYKGKFEAYQRTYVLTPYNHCHLYLIYFKLKNDIERLISQAAGSVIRYLTKGMIERINFFVPNELLLNEFNKYVEDIYRASDLIIKQNENLIKQRDLLLPRLMNGTITVK